jgi:hypothetical protein
MNKVVLRCDCEIRLVEEDVERFGGKIAEEGRLRYPLRVGSDLIATSHGDRLSLPDIEQKDSVF